MGNFSRDDTFDRDKHYVSVRLQQGVPVVDSDWNELQDIRKHELEEFLRWFVGDGVPMGDDGFAIGAVAGANDFSIASGHCLVHGRSVFNKSELLYTKQAEAPTLEPPPTGDREDTVYLEVWEREVDSEEDENIVNPDIGIETSVRVKREWAVRVAEGIATEEELSNLVRPESHVFCRLATINRKAGQAVIDNINDLRHTGLTLAGKVDRSGDRITGDLAVDGSVGIGTTNPKATLEVYRAAVDTNLLDLRSHYKTNTQGHGGHIRFMDIDTDTVIAEVRGAHREAGGQFGLAFSTDGDNERMCIDQDGNVGVGTASPAKKLHLQGLGSAPPLCNDPHDRPGLAIAGLYPQLDLFSTMATNANHGPTIRLGAYNDETKTSFKHWVIGTGQVDAHFLDFGFSDQNNPNPHCGVRNFTGKTVLTLSQEGNVGIGTTNPAKNLHIQGKGPAPLCNDSNDRPGLAITGLYPQLDLFSNMATNSNHGPAIRLGAYNDEAKTSFKHWVIGTAGRNASFLDFGFSDVNNPNPHAGIRNYEGRTILTLNQDGNVGIGTTSPEAKLHVAGDLIAGVLIITGPGFSIGRNDVGHEIIATDAAGNLNLKPAVDGKAVFVRDGNTARGIRLYGGGINSIQSVDLDGESPFTLTFQPDGGAVALPPGDYAEYFESLSEKEISAGTSVALEEDRVRPAKKGEAPIGVISANPAIVGGAHAEWPRKHLRNELGNTILEEYKEEVMAPKKENVNRERQKVQKKIIEEELTHTEIVLRGGKHRQKEITETVTREVEEPVFDEVDLYDETGKTVIGKHRVPVMETYEEEIDVLDDDGQPVLVGTGKLETKERPKLNPAYDESKEYLPREKRPEWNCVGLLGKLPLRKGQPVAESWIKMKDISDEVELWLVK